MAPGRRRGLHGPGVKSEPSPCGRSGEAGCCRVSGGGGYVPAPAAPWARAPCAAARSPPETPPRALPGRQSSPTEPRRPTELSLRSSPLSGL